MQPEERLSGGEPAGPAGAAPRFTGLAVARGQRDAEVGRSEQIAGVLGPTLAVLTASEALNLQIWETNLPPVIYLNGLFLFVAGLSIVRAHNRWAWTWPLSVTLVGWIALLGGLFRMFAPEAQQGGEDAATYAVIAAGFATGVFMSFKAYWPNGRRR